MDETLDKLKELIEKRKERIKSAGSEIFFFWGLILLAGSLVRAFLFISEWVSVITMIAGIAVQIIYIRSKRMGKGYVNLWKNTLNYMWIFIVIIIIIAGVIFPACNLYSGQAGSALSFLFASPGAFLSGIWLKKWSFKFGSLVFIIASIFIALPFPENKILVILPAYFLGLVIPGLTGKLEERYSSD
jgi:hypothetical protein